MLALRGARRRGPALDGPGLEEQTIAHTALEAPQRARLAAEARLARLAEAGRGSPKLGQLAEEGGGDDLDPALIDFGEGPTPRWAAIGGQDDKNWPPFMTVFKNPPRAYVAACAVGGSVTVLTLAIAAYQFKRLLSCPHSIRRSLYLRMVGLIVVLTVTAIFALCFAKFAVFFQAARSAFVGLTMLWIIELVFELGGGFSELCYAMAADAEAATHLLA